MQFRDVVGQQDVKLRFIRSVADSRIAHAQLIAGPEGTGKLALAIAYAQYINCQNRTPYDSCGECPSCRKVSKLIHPDLHFVFPVNASEDSKTLKVSDTFIEEWRKTFLANPYMSEAQWYEVLGLDSKQGNIGTNESIEILKKLSLKSFESEYKVMIVWLPERMHVSAANKMLKLIEEPPAKTLFLLVSECPTGILKTILSRTQLIKVPPLPREEIAAALVERVALSPLQAQQVARTANGNFQTALRLASDLGLNPNFEMFRELMRLCYSKNVNGLLDWVEKVARLGRERQKEFLTYSLGLVRESFMLNLNLPNLSYIAGQEADFGQKFSPYINGQNVPTIYKELNLAIEHVARNGNAHIIFTDLTMKLVKLINRKS